MERQRTIFLDMDGVCCDFVSAALQLHGVEPTYRIENWPKGTFEICDILNLTQEEFWEPIRQAGVDFWFGLVEYPYFRPLVEQLSEVAAVVFLTSPFYDADAAKGKVLWLQKHFGGTFDNFIITRKKFHCAMPGVVLVDDHPKHCEVFRANGAGAVLFPQPWNDAVPYTDVVVDTVVSVKRAFERGS